MNPWLLVTAFSGVALWLRVMNRFPQVFGDPTFVNFTESDAWFHVRVIEHMVHNFPHRLRVDPYGLINGGQSVDTGLFYDIIPAFLAWAAGLSDTGIHQLAAWYPALLGTLLVPVTFLCGRALFNTNAGLWAAATVATLPGHFLDTGSLGFTDHHVMEALLTSVLLWLLVREPRPSPALLGATLTAYLLTFAGGAFVVAIIALWYWLEAARNSEIDSRPFAIACLIALPFTYWQLNVYFMRYSFAAVLLAALGLWLLPYFAGFTRRQKYPLPTYLALSATACAAALTIVSIATAGQESLFGVIARMTASGSRLAPTVSELNSLTGAKGFFSLEYPWREYGGALIFTLTGLPLLAEAAWRHRNAKHTLFVLWAAIFFVMAMTQARMTYYFGVSGALLAGYLMSQVRSNHWATLALGAFLILPNLNRTLTDERILPGQVSPDWHEALNYLRHQTPEPFGNPSAFDGTPTGSPAYSVLAWWDYGYWITEVAHRVPVTNPTQANAAAAARFFIATRESDAQAALAGEHARYVVVNQRLLMIGNRSAFFGIFPNFFAYEKAAKSSDYILDVKIPGEAGRLHRRVFFRRPYFDSMLFRLYLGGGQGAPARDTGDFAVIEVVGNQVLRNERFTALADARRALAQCSVCEIASENPLTPFVDIQPVSILEPAFHSTSTTVRWNGTSRPEVQVYRVR